jgi:transposase
VSRRRRHSKGFKLAALARLETASDVRALAAELGIDRGLLYKWDRAFRSEGAAGLRLPGERSRVPACAAAGAEEAPTGARSSSEPDVAALERKVAQQALELDFFRAALRHFAARRRGTGGRGGTGSTP